MRFAAGLLRRNVPPAFASGSPRPRGEAGLTRPLIARRTRVESPPVETKFSGRAAFLRADWGEVEFDLAKGLYSLADRRGGEVATGLELVVFSSGERHYSSGAYVRAARAVEDGFEVSFRPTGRSPGMTARFTTREGAPGPFIELEVENTSGQELDILSADILHSSESRSARLPLFVPGERLRFYSCGLDMADAPVEEAGVDLISTPLAGLFKCARSGAHLLLGFVTAGRLPAFVEASRGFLRASCEFPRAPVAPEGRMRSEKLFLSFAGSVAGALRQYGELLGREMSARVPERPHTGWCSWYYFYDRVTEADVLRNLDYLTEHADEFPVEYFQIDDGYQKHWGDWLATNPSFPHDMGWLARRIKERGFKPGIWAAPLVVSRQSELFKAHPGWLIRSREGEPLLLRGSGKEAPWHALDGTRDDVCEHLEEMFRTMREEWGYEYFKLDALTRGMPQGAVFADSNLTRVGAFRRALEAIRRGCGDAFILGCTAPFGPCVGLVDGMRVSPDVGAVWKDECSAVSAMKSTIRRFFMNGTLWANDPDCAVSRGAGAGHPWREIDGLTLTEARTLTTVLGMSGGAVVLSEDMPALKKDRARLLKLLLPPAGRSAVPLDIIDLDPPEILHLSTDRCELLAFINWSDEERSIAVGLGELGLKTPSRGFYAFEFWSERCERYRHGNLSFKLAPHACALFRLTPAEERPQVVSTDAHITQIVREEWNDGELRVRLVEGVRAWVVHEGWKLEGPSDGLDVEEKGEFLVARAERTGQHALRFSRGRA